MGERRGNLWEEEDIERGRKEMDVMSEWSNRGEDTEGLMAAKCQKVELAECEGGSREI